MQNKMEDRYRGIKEKFLEWWAYEASDICCFNALSNIREINNRWFRGEEITNKERAHYYRAKGILISTLADSTRNIEEIFYFLNRGQACGRLAVEYIMS